MKKIILKKKPAVLITCALAAIIYLFYFSKNHIYDSIQNIEEEIIENVTSYQRIFCLIITSQKTLNTQV